MGGSERTTWYLPLETEVKSGGVYMHGPLHPSVGIWAISRGIGRVLVLVRLVLEVEQMAETHAETHVGRMTLAPTQKNK